MKNTETTLLKVPGAHLSYQVRGSGTPLLLIPGGGNDCSVFNGIARELEDQYRVIIYDRRGLSRSELDNPEEEQQVETHSNDAYLLLKESGYHDEPVSIFGSSGGAIVGLDLVARYPEQVKTLIAHEPPTRLSSRANPIQEMREISETYRREGIMAAMQKLMTQPGLNRDDAEIDLSQQEWTAEDRARSLKNMQFFLERELFMYDRYQLDFAALKSASTQTRILIAAGANNKEAAEYWSAVAVAERLGTTIVEFPGRHAGHVTHPKAFAQRLREILD